MATAAAALPMVSAPMSDRTEIDSRAIVLGSSSNELVFAVVGHAGSGTTVVANALSSILKETLVDARPFEVEIIKARDVIREWARKSGKQIPEISAGHPRLEDVRAYQDLGDEMRAAVAPGGVADHAAVARAVIGKIREGRARFLNVALVSGEPIRPDGRPRAYIVDSVRHPAEVNLLRNVYANAFVLVGVVCEQEKRLARISAKYSDAGREEAKKFMNRDAGVKEDYGQQVAKAFHLSDFFIDNTADRELEDGASNEAWEVNDHLSRLVKILTHSTLERPTIAETGMHHASSAQIRSACLSRQVGAALVDSRGNVVATGTNEAPKAGGGVYGESFERGEPDHRCGMMQGDQKFCRNTREQVEIIQELISTIPELRGSNAIRKTQLVAELQRSPIGGLLEFSRAVHAEMDAILSAGRQGVSLIGTRLFVTTFPCHYCARHIVSAGIDEVQYIEPYPKSKALDLHRDAIQVEATGWRPPSRGGPKLKVLFRPFSGVSPRFYKKAFFKDRDLKDGATGNMQIGKPEWGEPSYLGKKSYVELEAELSKGI